VSSELQKRAERAAGLFAQSARRPVVVEFAGVPKAGKTSTLTQVQAFLKRCGFRTEVVVERASVCPIRDKKHSTFNIWTACTTLSQILEKTQEPPRVDDPHILFLDRGLFDSICWMTMLEHLARIRPADRELVERFLRADDWCKRVTTVILMLASPEDAMKREQGVLPVEDGRGSIMNEAVLKQMRDTNRACAERLKNEFRVYEIDTSSGETRDNPKRTAEIVAELILSLVEEQVKEEILALPKADIVRLFSGRTFMSPDDMGALVAKAREAGRFAARDAVEADSGLVQALPIVVVRNASGAVLRLRRREKSEDNPLNQRVVIWAGGHVRSEDSTNGDALRRCALRELQEELRLSVEPKALRPLGAVYLDVGGKTSQHFAIAYEWCADSDDVAIALSNAEFFERRGTSLSGSFVDVDTLAQDVQDGRIDEPWSVELVQQCLGADGFEFTPRLL
jgi:predicted NUDIX family phosphoesterase